MIGTFSLCKGEIIQILVGQEGGINKGRYGSGGGGGTFVVRRSITSLIIAGGGGGVDRVSSRHAGCDASTSTTGNPGYRSWSGGSHGHGAQIADGDYAGGGGGGFYSSGRGGTNFFGKIAVGGEGGKGFLQGGVGGRARHNNADGGFGGGAGAPGWGGAAGGGGGYSGGGSGDDKPDSCGGGGGSYNAGTDQQNECGGGGGFYSSGRGGTNFFGNIAVGGEGGKGFLLVGVGGRARHNNAVRGFGGGAGAPGIVGAAGGDGGYSGGGSGDDKPDSCGGGGGSYNAGTDQQNECCFKTTGHGHVNVTLLQKNSTTLCTTYTGLWRRLKFSTNIDGYALQFHVIKKFHLSIYVGPSVRSACTHRCIMDPVWVSVNIAPPTDEKFTCELSDSDHTRHPEDLHKWEGFLYIGTEVIKLL
ncbi:glycine-rich protein DOT1-like [Orbicella faveolata]|uniref:glycine-rich protein DOT1-like n=1 Tax=Orbicella faveolata TaxID=48498 RepID=UPI0009E1DDAC|nr:glycine-rich protein DOT1-like [Orbicella faveolata]